MKWVISGANTIKNKTKVIKDDDAYSMMTSFVHMINKKSLPMGCKQNSSCVTENAIQQPSTISVAIERQPAIGRSL